MFKCCYISFPLHDLFFGLMVWNIRSTETDKWTLSTGTALALHNRMCHVAPGRSKQNWPCTICNSENVHESPKIFFPPATGQVPAVCWCFLRSATGPQPTGQCGGILQNSNRIRKDLMIGSVVVGFLFVFHLGVLFYEPSIILACSNCPAPTARGLLSWKGAGHHETPQPFVPHQWGAATPSWEWFLPQLFKKKEPFTWSPAKSDWNWACRITST